MGLSRTVILSAALGAALAGCDMFGVAGGGVRTTNGEEELAGGGIRTTNGEVAGRIKLADASPAEGAQVRLYKVFLSDTSATPSTEWAGVSDSNGIFRLQNVGSGTFAMSVTYPSMGTRAIIPRLTKSMEGLEIPGLVLSPWVTLVGRVFPGTGADPREVRVCIPGLAQCVHPGPDSVYAFTQAPQGDYDVVFLYQDAANYLPIRVTRRNRDTVYVKDIQLDTGVTASSKKFIFYETDMAKSLYVVFKNYPKTRIPAWYAGKDFGNVLYFVATNDQQFEQLDFEDYEEWTYHKAVPLKPFAPKDTAAILRDFPYFLRLTAADIDFSKGAGDGSDLRVTRGNITRHSAYYLQRWDSAAGIAELWVNVETIMTANANLGFGIHLGNPEARDRSDRIAVLGRTAGARQVWTFDDNAATSLIGDMSGTHSGYLAGSGALPVPTSARATAGILGRALKLDGASDQITIDPHPALDHPEMSVSIWARNSAAKLAGQEYLAMKGEDGRKQWHMALGPDSRLRVGFGKDSGAWSGAWVSRDPIPAIDTWHLYSATFKSGVVRAYLDGVELPAGKPNGTIPNAIPMINSPLYLGRSVLVQTEPFWAGEVDNLTLENNAQSPDWFRHLFATQKP